MRIRLLPQQHWCLGLERQPLQEHAPAAAAATAYMCLNTAQTHVLARNLTYLSQRLPCLDTTAASRCCVRCQVQHCFEGHDALPIAMAQYYMLHLPCATMFDRC